MSDSFRIHSRRSYTLLLLVILISALAGSGCRRVNSSAVDEQPRRQSKRAELKGPYESGIWNSETITEMGVILQRYLGTPYKGSSKYQTGIDCSRFTSEVYRKFDKTVLPRVARDQANVGRPVSRSKLGYGDLVFFETGGGGVSHVGIYVGFGGFIHASSSRGVVIDDLHSKYWSKRFLDARRVIDDPSLKKPG